MGVFADGADPFAKDNLMGLTGSATYRGDAVGLHGSRPTVGDTPVISGFTADVELTANFGNGRALGSVSGTVSNFEVGGEAKSMTLNLGNADIADAPDGGFFSGYTRTAGDYLTGKWGGQFYGDGAGATDHPGSVAGTFGAARTGVESYIGAFGAYNGVAVLPLGGHSKTSRTQRQAALMVACFFLAMI